MAGKMSWMRKSNNRPDSANTIVQPTLQFPSERITIIITSQSSHWSLMVDSMFWLAEDLHRAQNLEIIAVIIQTLPFSHLLPDSHQHFTGLFWHPDIWRIFTQNFYHKNSLVMLESSKSKQCKLVQFLHEFVRDYPAQSDIHWNIQKTSFPAIFHHKIFSVTTLSIMFIARL